MRCDICGEETEPNEEGMCDMCLDTLLVSAGIDIIPDDD